MSVRPAPAEDWSTTYDADDRCAPPPDSAAMRSGAAAGRVPGEAGLWVFIFGDMLAFGLFFGVFLYERGGDPAAFDTARRGLEIGFAVANTVLLLTSSWLVVMAVRAVRDGRRALAPRLLLWAALCGVGFVANKGIEWHALLEDGRDPGTSGPDMFFFMLTGIHGLHVLIGLLVLGFAWRMTRRATARHDEVRLLESSATYWHMVDLLWIVLFPLLYLVS